MVRVRVGGSNVRDIHLGVKNSMLGTRGLSKRLGEASMLSNLPVVVMSAAGIVRLAGPCQHNYRAELDARWRAT